MHLTFSLHHRHSFLAEVPPIVMPLLVSAILVLTASTGAVYLYAALQ